MHTVLRLLIVGVVLGIGGVATVSADAAADPIDGTWKLNVAKSKFSPGPALQSQTRTYAETTQGVALTFSGVAADGSHTSGQSTYKYDGKDYPLTGSPNYDAISLTRIDANTVKSVQKRAGKEVGSTTRTISKDGKTMTLASTGTSAKGSPYNDVLVFDRQ
jgi:hypothetical protein